MCFHFCLSKPDQICGRKIAEYIFEDTIDEEIEGINLSMK